MSEQHQPGLVVVNVSQDAVDQREVLRHMREHPSCYIGERSLGRLSAFFDGYATALNSYGLNNPNDLLRIPREFDYWVAYRLRSLRDTAGYCHLIYEHTSSEAEAVEMFFELLDEFHARRPHIVARLTGIRRTYEWTVDGRTETRPFPDSISLVTYTDDPGFFVQSDTKVEWPSMTFFPNIGWFETFLGFKREELTIVDPMWNFGLPCEERSEGTT